jgi:hypothetical protein
MCHAFICMLFLQYVLFNSRMDLLNKPATLAPDYCSMTHLQVEVCMLRGATLEGLRRMLLLVLLQDAAPLGPAPLLPSHLLPLEELLLVVPSNQAEMLLSIVPNLLRMINSGAGMIQGELNMCSCMLTSLHYTLHAPTSNLTRRNPTRSQ